jgi:hypothetical protein
VAAFGAGAAAPGAVIGTVTDAPQAHFAFFPAISGFHRNVFAHPVQGNLGSVACAIVFPSDQSENMPGSNTLLNWP